MKRGTIFLTAFLSAAITFGSLMAFVGPQNSGWNRDRYGWYGGGRHHHHYYYDDDRQDRYERPAPADTSNRY